MKMSVHLQKKITDMERERIIASQRDSEIFFNAVLQQARPNDKLLEAVNEYNQIITKRHKVH